MRHRSRGTADGCVIGHPSPPAAITCGRPACRGRRPGTTTASARGKTVGRRRNREWIEGLVKCRRCRRAPASDCDSNLAAHRLRWATVVAPRPPACAPVTHLDRPVALPWLARGRFAPYPVIAISVLSDACRAVELPLSPRELHRQRPVRRHGRRPCSPARFPTACGRPPRLPPDSARR